MKKITILLEDAVDQSLREYVSKTYPVQPYGKLSEVINAAVVEYLKSRS